MMYFDTHTHLTDERFDADRDALLSSLPHHGLALALDVACALGDFPKTLALTQAYPWIYGAYGVHPHYAAEAPDGKKLRRMKESAPSARSASIIFTIIRRAKRSAACLRSSLRSRSRLASLLYCISGKHSAIAWTSSGHIEMVFAA